MGDVIQLSKVIDRAIEKNQTVRRLDGDVSVLKQDVAILKQDVAILKQDVAEIRERLLYQGAIIEQLDHKMNQVLDFVIAAAEDRQRVRQVERTVIVCEDKLGVVEVALGHHIRDPKAHSPRKT